MKISQKAMAYLAWWIIEEIQKSLSLASATRLHLPPDDFRYFHVQLENNYVRIFVNGENNGPLNFEVWIDFTTNTAEVIIDSVYSLIRPDRYQEELPMLDPNDTEPDGTIKRIVNFTDALERIPLWEAMPQQAPKDSHNKPPNIVGGFQP